ncbi:MAG: nitrilotriacetate monooxygenase [Acidimicrobiia bacterium]|nr:MAG: nitrilotriacetate monooxygenase [Acidimicrobiia bacterium]
MPPIDPIDFRRAASHFLTGVTVITTLDEAGRPAGLTANSFSTVSLRPPLVLFCLGRESDTFEAFGAGNGYVVHVLGADQQDLAERFAAKGIDRFEGVDWTPGHNGLPVLPGALSRFECDLAHSYEGGDHLILVGEVRHLTYAGLERPALGYFRGGYVVHPPWPR